MAKTPQVGEQAPDFELAGTDGPFRLSDHRGERVVLLFYPGDNTMVCTKQFCSYRDRAEDFASLNATVVGISSQDVSSHEQFKAKQQQAGHGGSLRGGWVMSRIVPRAGQRRNQERCNGWHPTVECQRWVSQHKEVRSW